LNHSALNVANAIGAWLGGLVIAAGYSYRAPSFVGAALALGGVAVFAVTVLAARGWSLRGRGRTVAAAR
ncbi:MAG: hypothetical protein QM658_07465, partial [Gordonia sp. (in: high G+C Gram-positive bacteria)]